MKYLITFILMLTALTSKAQQIRFKYSKFIEPFELLISGVELQSKATIVSIAIKNTAIDTRYVNFADGEYAYSDKWPRGIRAINNSLQFNSTNKNLKLSCNELVSFKITFSNRIVNPGNIFSLKLGKYFVLDNIIIPSFTSKGVTSFANLNKRMQTWEQFYNARRNATLTYNNNEEVKIAIQNNVENWQKKGEFESTSAWKNRVNEESRQKYISDIITTYSEQHKKELERMMLEQKVLVEDYEAYKKNILNSYYQSKIARASYELNNSDFELKPYDADNETFLIHNSIYGDILLPVPIYEAASFKNNWEIIKEYFITSEFVPDGEDIALNKLTFINNDRVYIYDNQTIANYAITDVDYNFEPVKIAEINFPKIRLEDIKITSHIEQPTTIVGLNNQREVLRQTKVTLSQSRIISSDKSDVDIAIPKNPKLKDPTTFAVIIANEKYISVSDVPYAENDGIVFSKYLTNTLGLPTEHVKIFNNATFGNIVGALKHINNLSLAFGDKLNLILYYAGHGLPNEQTKKCMLLPVDGDPQIPETCYDADKLYTTLGALNANSIVVLLDACFSGSLRGEGMLFASRSVKIKTSHVAPKGNMVIISASQGDETALPFEKEQHGMFTYYLLKYLQDSKGKVALGDLCDYLIQQVKRQSVVSNGKLQTPMVQYPPEIENYWRSWRLAQ